MNSPSDALRVFVAWATGVVAGAWFASKARQGEELIAAGLLMLAGHTDLDQLDQWIRVGWERRCGASVPYPDSND